MTPETSRPHHRLRRSAVALVFAAMALHSVSAVAGDRLIVCGAKEVFIIPADIAVASEVDRMWHWTAADSPEIPETLHARFRTTDECKPFGPYILITASADGVALVRREDKRCVFHTTARNAHSACLLPGERIAVVASTGGDELLVFDQNRPGAEIAPLARLPLDGAHGLWWDVKSSRLWALGTQELLKVEVIGAGLKTQLRVEARFELPTPGGHDLSPARATASRSWSRATRTFPGLVVTGSLFNVLLVKQPDASTLHNPQVPP